MFDFPTTEKCKKCGGEYSLLIIKHGMCAACREEEKENEKRAIVKEVTGLYPEEIKELQKELKRLKDKIEKQKRRE